MDSDFTWNGLRFIAVTKMPKICFIEPPYGWFAEKLDPPFPLMYLAAVAEKCGWEAQIIDMETLEDPLPEADVYGVTATSAQWPITPKLSDRLAEEHPESLRIVGGNHVSAEPSDSQATKFDVCVIGEGEIMLEQILNDPEKWKSDKPKIVYGIPVEDLDSVPFPSRHLIDWKQYKRGIFWGNKLLEPAVGIIMSRGCPYSCIFCASHVVFGHRTRFRSIPNVVMEMKNVISELGYHGFNWHDDTFALNPNRVVELCREFKKLNVVWRCLSRVNTVNEKLLETMRDAGCKEIIYGIESGSKKILDILQKGSTVEQNLKAMKLTKQAGIQLKVGIIIGSPGETWETVAETKKLLKECPPDFWNVSVMTPYPGSALWRTPEKFGMKILTRDLTQYAMVGKEYKGNVCVETKEMSKEDIEHARDELIELCLDISPLGET